MGLKGPIRSGANFVNLKHVFDELLRASNSFSHPTSYKNSQQDQILSVITGVIYYITLKLRNLLINCGIRFALAPKPKA